MESNFFFLYKTKVYDTFRTMNKTVEVITLYEFFEFAPKTFKTTIDVELKNAADFSFVPLLVEPSDGTIRVAENAPLLATFRSTFQNVTRGLNLNPNLITIDCENIEILFDQKPASAVAIVTGIDSPRLFTTANASRRTSSADWIDEVKNSPLPTTTTTTITTASTTLTTSSSLLLSTLVAKVSPKTDVETRVE